MTTSQIDSRRSATPGWRARLLNFSGGRTLSLGQSIFLVRTLLLVLSAALWLSSCSKPGSKEITILYPSASGLVVGDELQMSGFPIGEVKVISVEPNGQVAIRVQILPKYAEHVTEGAQFSIEREAMFSSDRLLVMKPGEGTVAPDGFQFVGVPTWEDRLKSMTNQLLDSTGNTDFREHLDALAEAAEEAAKAGSEEWKERRPEIEAEAKRLLEELEREGNKAAEELRTEIERYLEDLLAEPQATADDDATTHI